MITGEAGIGKSRLVEHMLDRFVPKGTHVIHLTASAFDEDSPLRPMVDYFRATAGLDSADSSTTALGKLEAILVGDARERRRALPIVAALTSISVDIPGIQDILPDQLRQQTIAVLIEQFLSLNRLPDIRRFALA